MAYRRNITARAKLFYQQQHRIAPSFSHTHRDESDRNESPAASVSRNPGIPNFFQHQSFGHGCSFSSIRGSRDLLQDRRFAMPIGCAPVFARNFSSGSFGEGAAEKIGIMSDVLVEKSVEVAPVVNEVAVAAADSFFPVAALQHIIDYIHCFTGFDWWASIVLATIMIRLIQIPIMINQLKSTTKFSLLRPKLEAVKEEMQNRDMSPSAVAEGQARMTQLFKEYGVTPFTPLKGILISGPLFCSFFFAISNMAEKVPSFKDGGILWFTDLSTPDTMYIFPVLTALTFWITVELNAQEGLEGNPTAGTIKNVSRVFAALTIPLTSTFPKAIFCYWMTSNLYSMAYGLVIKRPAVKKLLNVPILPPEPPPAANQKSGLSFFATLKKFAEAQQKLSLASSPAQQQASLPSTAEATPKPANKKIPSLAVLSRRIKSLEKEVKGRKKGKKR